MMEVDAAEINAPTANEEAKHVVRYSYVYERPNGVRNIKTTYTRVKKIPKNARFADLIESDKKETISLLNDFSTFEDLFNYARENLQGFGGARDGSRRYRMFKNSIAVRKILEALYKLDVTPSVAIAILTHEDETIQAVENNL